ncbi:probable CCR4-associated factor 1 homolog 11 [Oryza brachyantha]|uniref:probable CCR4-associated factor 1 homolog 11 n=1 Tax=Oryza brachyantha TaxID=4533 RepID=UPI0007761181|nr:probable CCR4-associated factor 1 homolog 11 [Oryza brachyantha]
MPSEFVAARKKPPPVMPVEFAAGRKKPPPGIAVLPSGFAGAGRKKQPAPVEIRQVWAHNVEEEFRIIRNAIDHFPYVAMDTEFPGVIHRPSKHPALLTANDRYELLRRNVDALHLIQVGITLAASPTAPPALAFEINLCDFDQRVHRHAPESVQLLESHGLDLAAHRKHGVRASALAPLLMSSGLVCSHGAVKWVTFHSAYDFAYLIKLLMGRKLPRSMAEFLNLVRVFFGDDVYDVKHMMQHCGDLYGGLERVAATLQVKRAAGRCHQAASDSLLTWDVFRRMRELYFLKEGVQSYQGVLFGLELDLHSAKNTASLAAR